MTVNRKLQVKFIITTLIAVIIIVIGVFGIVTFENYKMTNEQLNAILSFISENDGVLPEIGSKKYDYLAAEARYSTRFFTIKLNNKDEITEINVDNIFALSKDEAKILSKEVLRKIEDTNIFQKITSNASKNQDIYGFFSNYKYKISKINNGKMIVFIDCQMQLESFKMATFRSFAFVCMAIAMILIILIGTSKKILSPIFKSIESQKNFVTNASHEFKTPLAVVMADIDILEMTVGEDNEWLKSIKNQTNRLNTLTRTLLTLSNVQDGRASLVTSKFSINDLITEVIEELKILIGDRKINFNKNLDAIMTADRDMIKQVINILFDNAIKYTPEDGEITITTRKKRKKCKI